MLYALMPEAAKHRLPAHHPQANLAAALSFTVVVLATLLVVIALQGLLHWIAKPVMDAILESTPTTVLFHLIIFPLPPAMTAMYFIPPAIFGQFAKSSADQDVANSTVASGTGPVSNTSPAKPLGPIASGPASQPDQERDQEPGNPLASATPFNVAPSTPVDSRPPDAETKGAGVPKKLIGFAIGATAMILVSTVAVAAYIFLAPDDYGAPNGSLSNGNGPINGTVNGTDSSTVNGTQTNGYSVACYYSRSGDHRYFWELGRAYDPYNDTMVNNGGQQNLQRVIVTVSGLSPQHQELLDQHHAGPHESAVPESENQTCYQLNPIGNPTITQTTPNNIIYSGGLESMNPSQYTKRQAQELWQDNFGNDNGASEVTEPAGPAETDAESTGTDNMPNHERE